MANINIIYNTINVSSTIDSQSFVSSVTSDRVFNYINNENTSLSTRISKDSSPCYGLCCSKNKCKNNN